jgi:hypothetical protein
MPHGSMYKMVCKADAILPTFAIEKLGEAGASRSSSKEVDVQLSRFIRLGSYRTFLGVI